MAYNNAAPPIPPLPANYNYNYQTSQTPHPYETSPPHFTDPLVAPRPHRVDPGIPANVRNKHGRLLFPALQKKLTFI
jgi:hypothetical protein